MARILLGASGSGSSGTLDVDLNGATTGNDSEINATQLGGKPASDYVLKNGEINATQLGGKPASDYALNKEGILWYGFEPVWERITNSTDGFNYRCSLDGEFVSINNAPAYDKDNLVILGFYCSHSDNEITAQALKFRDETISLMNAGYVNNGYCLITKDPPITGFIVYVQCMRKGGVQ